MADWSVLPNELLRLIAKRLNSIVCHAAFRSICKSWRSIALNDFSDSLPPQPPWLILPDPQTKKNKLSSFNRNMSCQLDIPEDGTKQLIGSSGTWLIFSDTDQSLIQILNPLSKIEICLPSKVKEEEEEEKLISINKIALSSSRPLVKNPRDMIAVAIYDDSTKLGFIRPGDEAWTPIAIEYDWNLYFTDMIFYKQQLYAVNEIGTVFVCDINNVNKATQLSDHSNEIPDYRLEYWRCRTYCWDITYYLVEVMGDLMLVFRLSLYDGLMDGFRETREFSVFKLDFDCIKWKWVKSLGNHSLFLGDNVSTALVASNDSTFARNSIYYSDEQYEWASFRVMCVYDLELEGECRCMYYLSASPIWIIPNTTTQSQ